MRESFPYLKAIQLRPRSNYPQTLNHKSHIYSISSTAQYEEEYLDKFGCLPNGGSGPKIVDDSALSCTSQPDCELFGTKCCETAAPCVDDPDCLLFGTGCCEVPQPKDVCVPNEENCEIFGEDCCVGEPVDCTEDDLLFGDCGTTSPPPSSTTPANPPTPTEAAQSTTPRPPRDTTNPPRGEPSCGNRNPTGVDKVPVSSFLSRVSKDCAMVSLLIFPQS